MKHEIPFSQNHPPGANDARSSSKLALWTWPAFVSALVLAFLLTGTAPALADDTWTGATNANWSNSGNWNNGTPATAPYGTLFFATTANSPSNDDLSGTISHNKLLFNTTGAFTINGTGTISLFDNGGTQAKVENNSGSTSGVATLNFGTLSFAATSGAAYAEINAVTGGITFGTNNTLNVNGSQVAGVRMFGGGNTTTFNGTVNATGKYFAMTNVGNNVVIGGTFTSGDFYVMDSGTLNVAGSGFTTTAVRLGGDFGTTGNQNLALGATLNLTTATGGQTFANTINPLSGNTSAALVVNSQNTSGTNTISGSVFLDSNLAVNQSAGGTLTLSGTTLDLKAQTLTFNSGTNAGAINVTSPLTNSTGSGSIVIGGTGTGTTVTLSGASTYTGATTVNAGKLVLDSAGTTTARLANTSGITLNTSGVLQLANSTGTASLDRIGGSVPVNLNGGTFNTGGLGEHGGAASGPGVTPGMGALTLAASSVIDMGAGSSVLAFTGSSAATWASGTTLSVYNWSGNGIVGGGTDELFFGSNAAGLTSTQLGQIRFYSDAGTTLLGGTSNMILSDGEVIPAFVPEPATWLGGALLLFAAVLSLRRRNAAKA